MRESSHPITVRTPGVVDYQTAWDLQRATAESRVAGTGPDTLIVLEHPAVYTAGRRTMPLDRPTDGTPVIDVDRGGSITWHGPGQLVAYPIVKLARALYVVDYVRLLERAIMATCRELGLETVRVKGRSGVWIAADRRGPERKVAAIGVRVAKGVTSHGVSLNCNPDMAAFDRIVPCGIADAGVTSLSRELDRDVTVHEVQPILIDRMTAALDGLLPPAAATDSATHRPADQVAGHVGNGVQWQLAPALGRPVPVGTE